jgi:transcriptional regulator with XRE-family HTH domain
MLRFLVKLAVTSQVQLADMVGMSRSNICDIEKDRRTVSLEKAAEFARVLGYSENQFVATIIEDQLRSAGLPFMVELKKAACCGYKPTRGNGQAKLSFARSA